MNDYQLLYLAQYRQQELERASKQDRLRREALARRKVNAKRLSRLRFLLLYF